MARRILLVALALCLTGWGLRAAERATFILNDGQRVSGMLDTREMSGGLSIVPTNANREEQFSFDQVAVIDFVGGAPRQNELSALPDSGHHLMAMRNGGVRVGYLVSVSNGDTVVWQEEGGGRRNIPVRQIARIYLNPANARSVFNYGEATPRSAPPYGNAYGYQRNRGGRDFQIIADKVSVPGNQAWTDTGVDVMRGDVLRFDDQGGITYIQGENNTANAGGKPEMKSDKFPVPSAGVGALIGKVGTSGTPFYVGAGAKPVTMPATGRLFLGVNDDNFGDNTGAFTVTIMRR